ncbi:MAG: hypothetical protein ACRDHL_14755 [Candidatus Promineifilaceae bacterium]
MNAILNTFLPILAGLCLLGAAYFVVQGLQARKGAPDRSYGVARQEARQEMLVGYARAAAALLFGLVLLAIFSLARGPLPGQPAPSPSAEPRPTAAATETNFDEGTPTPETPTAEPSPTGPLVRPSDTPSPTPSITPTEVTPTALVNSPNGLWLREAPGGTQEVELIPDGAVLTLLEGLETADDLEWQEVRTPAGQEGWVAVEFVVYQ